MMNKSHETTSRFEQSTPPSYLSLARVEQRVNRKKSWIYAEIRANRFPDRKVLGWLSSDIDSFVMGTWQPEQKAA